MLADEKGNVLCVRVDVLLSEGSSCSRPSCAMLGMNQQGCCPCRAVFFHLCVCEADPNPVLVHVRAGEQAGAQHVGLLQLHGPAGSVLPLESSKPSLASHQSWACAQQLIPSAQQVRWGVSRGELCLISCAECPRTSVLGSGVEWLKQNSPRGR